MNDEKLNRILQSWKVDSPLSLAFQREVWRRISAQQKEPFWSEWLDGLLTWVARPVPAAIAAVLAVAGGVSAAGMLTPDPSRHAVASYTAAIDPLSHLSR